MARRVTSLYAMLALMVPGVLVAQGSGAAAEHAAHEAMMGPMAPNPHLRMTPRRAMTADDSVRAMALADTIRRAITKYADPRSAERDGYRLFAPKVKDQKEYHYTNWGHAVQEVFRFNPAKPTSILYRRDSTGQLRLSGAMYTSPKRTAMSRLDSRIPFGVTQWHLHVNLCVPHKGEERRLAERRDGKPLFGTEGTIVTERECRAADGDFHDTLFGWMVHANVYDGTDLATVWGHGGHDDHR